ncbi:MAG: hypothetical protein IJ026_04005 [Candidatus Methanomethylophilaceae archaeon]|nr:hypothetical protein [Candidatus Methanomethylophilaceae archaeon]
MVTREDVIRAMEGDGGIHPPAVFTQSATTSQMEACGSRWPEANFDGDAMVRLSLQLNRSFGFASARVPFDLTNEAEAFGCGINPGREAIQTSVASSPYRRDGCIPDVSDDLPPVDVFLSSGRLPTVVSAAGRISGRGELFLTAGMNGPFALVNSLLGVENVLIGLLMEPEAVQRWLTAVTPYLSAYAHTLSEVADNVQIMEESGTDITPPYMFKTVIGDHLPEVVSAAHGSFTTIHSCGNTFPVAAELSRIGSDALSVEASSDPVGYRDLVGGSVRLVGGIDTVRTLLSGSPADVAASARNAADAGFDVVAPECGVPPRTSDGNLRALAGYLGGRGYRP